ncbi:hypothetical protein ACA910_013451 [Epithemia clementina (nom. ined.)]
MASKTVDDEMSPLLLHHQLMNKVTAKNDNTDDESTDVTVSKTSRPDVEELPSLWKSYTQQLDKNPVLVKCITAFFILGLGDLCGQGVEHLRGTNAEEGVDWLRSGRFSVIGFIGAVWAHYYYHYLDYTLPPTEAPCTTTTALKLLIDQGLQAPILLATIIGSLAIMRGTGWDGVKDDLEENYGNTLLANWKLWIPANLVNLAFVRPELRVLYVNVVFFIWTIILSVMLNEESS